MNAFEDAVEDAIEVFNDNAIEDAFENGIKDAV